MNPDLSIEDAKLAVAVHLHALEAERVFWHTLRTNQDTATSTTQALISAKLGAINPEKAALNEMASILAAL